MIYDAYPQKLSAFGQSPGSGDILAARSWITAGMVMNEHNSRGALSDSRAEHFSGMDDGAV